MVLTFPPRGGQRGTLNAVGVWQGIRSIEISEMCLYSFIHGFSFDICCLFYLICCCPRDMSYGESSLQPSGGWCGESSKECFLREIPSLSLGLPGEQNTMWSNLELMIIKTKSKLPKVLHLVVSPESVAQWDLCLESFVWHPPQPPLSSGYGSSLFSADARLFMLFDKWLSGERKWKSPRKKLIDLNLSKSPEFFRNSY